MIAFRYHVVSIVAVFLALAGGIALGSGPLQGSVRGELAGSSDDTDTAAALAEAERVADFQSGYAEATAGRVLGGRLAETSVSLVVLPGADPGVVSGLEQDLAAAEANVVSRVDLTPALLDPANRQLAESLAQSVLDRVEGAPVAEGATSYSLVGAALSRSYLTASTEAVVRDDAATTIEAGFVEAELVAEAAPADNRAELALVVTGPLDGGAADAAGAADVAAELSAAFDRSAGGAVVVGTADDRDSGAVEALQASGVGDDVSTVDAGDTAAGRAVAVLALAEQAAGESGHYGVDAPDGVAPD